MWLAHKTLPPRTDRLFSVIHLLKKSGPVKTIGVWLSMVFLKTKTNKQIQTPKDPLSSAHTVSCWDLQLSSGKANSNNATSPVLVHFLCSDPVQSVGPVENENVLLISRSLACIYYVALGNGKLIKHFRAGVLFIFHFISFFFFFFFSFCKTGLKDLKNDEVQWD